MKSFLIIGMGKFGHHLCRDLASLGNEVMIVDEHEEKLSDMLDVVTEARIADATRPDVLQSFDVPSFDCCIVCIAEDFQASLEITSQLSDLQARYVVSLAETDIQRKFLLRNGANAVVYPDRDVSQRLAVSLDNDSIFDYFRLNDTFAIYEISAPRAWLDRTIGELDVRSRHGINIVAIKHNGEVVDIPTAHYRFNTTDHLLVMGRDVDLEKLV